MDTSGSSNKNQRLTVSNCLSQQQNDAPVNTPQKPPASYSGIGTNFSKIESLLSTSQKSILKKKSSFINRKTIRNYTAAAAAAAQAANMSAAAAAQAVSSANSFKNSLLLLQPNVEASSEFSKNFANIHSSYFSHLNSLSAADALLQRQHQQPQSSLDENANLRLLVEVAVGLWEEQQRNYQYRN